MDQGHSGRWHQTTPSGGLSVKLLSFNPKASLENLRGDLITLAGQWAVLAASPLDDYEYSDGEECPDTQDDDSSHMFKKKNEKHPSCKKEEEKLAAFMLMAVQKFIIR